MQGGCQWPHLASCFHAGKNCWSQSLWPAPGTQEGPTSEAPDLDCSEVDSRLPLLVCTLSSFSVSSCLLFSLLFLPFFLSILSIHSFFLPWPRAYLWLPRTLFNSTEKHSELIVATTWQGVWSTRSPQTQGLERRSDSYCDHFLRLL